MGTSPVRGVAFSPNGGFALSGGDDGVVRLWRLPKLTMRFENNEHEMEKIGELVTKFVKQKSKPKTLGFSRMGCRAGAITPALSIVPRHRAAQFLRRE